MKLDEEIKIDENELDELIYPINIHNSIKAAGGMNQREKNSLLISFWVVINLIGAWFLAGIIRNVFPNHYFLVTTLIVVAIQLTLGVYLLGFLLDERSLSNEMNSTDNLFTNYFNLYQELVAGDNSPYEFDVIELDDGSFITMVQCLMGYNTQSRCRATQQVNQAVETLLLQSNFTYRKIFMNEVFRESIAANQLLNILKSIEEPELFQSYRQILLETFNVADTQSNAMCVTYIIHATTRIQKDDLGETIRKILALLSRGDNVFREVKVLTSKACIDFIRKYNRLEVLDMGMVKTQQAVKRKSNCSIKLLKLKGTSGKIYTTTEYKNLINKLLSEFGLEG